MEDNQDEDLLSRNLDRMLEYEIEMFLDMLHKDGLLVAAKGLNVDRVVLNLLKVHCDPGNLVLVLNSSDFEDQYFITKLNDSNVNKISFSASIGDREDMYLSGGVKFISTRILVVDMLKKRIQIDKITGIVVLRAHKVLESCQEAFVLRLFRQHNKTGFVKAFSNSAQSFTVGFGHVERIMRTLFVKELYIWPRFHSLVNQTLKERQPTVVELHVPISETMSKIQTCLLDLMNLCVKELKRVNKSVEFEEITVENCLLRKFHKMLQYQMDSVWNQLSAKSRQLIADLKTLRHLILLMLNTDPVQFYATVFQYHKSEYAHTSIWVLMEPAVQLFNYTSSLLFANKELNPQMSPKWRALSEILEKEIPAQIDATTSRDNNILILCQDSYICYQLNHILQHGPRHYLFSSVLKHGIAFTKISDQFKEMGGARDFNLEQIEEKPAQTHAPRKNKSNEGTTEEGEKNEDDEEEENLQDSYLLTMNATADDAECTYVFTQLDMNLMQLLEVNKATENVNNSVLIRSFKSADDFLELGSVLEELKPNFIIMYNSNVTAIRNIEVYKARMPDSRPFKLYFLIHTETVEEQSYLTALRREKEAFEFLIETKSTMVIPQDEEFHLQRGANEETSKNTRQGGVAEPEQNRIIVDMREFRSELPALIHKRGIDIEPLTISIGDYILTPDICIERKTLSDLIGSLNSGRLYQQCLQMSRYYAQSMLLIEFDQNKPFSWQHSYMISNDGNSFDIQQKLILLTLHYPKLKIVWSASPYASAQLFEELKMGKAQPQCEQVSGSGGDEPEIDLIETKFNVGVFDFVRKLPGITSKNIERFLRGANDWTTCLNWSQEELKAVVGNNVDATELHAALHGDTQLKNKSDASEKGKKKFKFKKR